MAKPSIQQTYQVRPARVRNRLRRFILRSARFFVPAFVGRLADHMVWLRKFSAWTAEQREVPAYASRGELHARIVASEGLNAAVDYLEFGVAYGDSMAWWCKAIGHPEARFFGFDTFTGLPEAWGKMATGSFSAGGTPPDIADERVAFHVGLFSQTLPPFIAQHAFGRRLVVHMDADLFTSTLFVLTRLAPYLKPGDILLFDELGSVRLPYTEFRGFLDFAEAYGLKYEVLGSSLAYQQVAMRVISSDIVPAEPASRAPAG